MTAFIIYSGYFLLFLNTYLYASYFSKLLKPFKLITYYLIVTLIIQVVSLIFSQLSIKSLYISHFYFISQFIILSFFYLEILKDSRQKIFVKKALPLVLLILGVQFVMKPELIFKFNLFEIFITNFLIIIYSTFYLYDLLISEKKYYYINLGILVYLIGSTMVFLLGNVTILNDSILINITWRINQVLYILFQLIILYEWKVSIKNVGIDK